MWAFFLPFRNEAQAKKAAADAKKAAAKKAKTAAKNADSASSLIRPPYASGPNDRVIRGARRGQDPAPAPGAPGEGQDPSNIHNNSSNIHNNSSETGSERSTDADFGLPKCSSLSGGNGEG